MKRRIIFAFISIVVITGGLISCSQPRTTANPDQLVLDKLKQAGTNLTKPHDIEFFLYFPTEKNANIASEELRQAGLDAKTELGADKKFWLCFATKRMIPDLSELAKLRVRFDGIATKLNGKYDGWGTEIVK